MAAPEDRREGRFQTGRALTVGAAHFFHDIFTAFLPALLPVLIERLGLTLWRAGLLDVCIRGPSVLNPFLGSLFDRSGLTRGLVIVSPAVTCVAICTIGLASSYAALTAILLTCGLSVAAFHVASPVIMADVSGNRAGRGMSFFMVGGELARTLGPLIAVWALAAFTLEGLWKIIPTGILGSLLLWWRLRRYPLVKPRERPVGLFVLWIDMRRVLMPVLGILVARAFMVAALTTFLTTFLVRKGQGLWLANISLSILEFSGAFGALFSGTLSDWLGRRNVLVVVAILAPVLMLLFVRAEGAMTMPLLIGLGFVTLASTPVVLALVVEQGGANRAAASGTFMMMSFAIRSSIVLLVGYMGDEMGLEATFEISAYIAALGLPCALALPRTDE